MFSFWFLHQHLQKNENFFEITNSSLKTSMWWLGLEKDETKIFFVGVIMIAKFFENLFIQNATMPLATSQKDILVPFLLYPAK